MRLRRALDGGNVFPGLLAVFVFLVWGAVDGGFAPTLWYPGGLFLLGLLLAIALARPEVLSARRLVVLAGAFLFAFTVWSFLSILWADAKGDAWDGANRTLLYLVIYALFSLWAWRPESVASLVALLALGVALIGTALVLRAATADDLGEFFVEGRFAGPAGYSNASAAFFLAAFWPAVLLASRREAPVLLRGLLVAAAGLLLELALLTQSRGSLFAFPLLLALYLVLVPGRLRSLVVLPLPLGAAAATAPRLLDVYQAFAAEADASAALAAARDAMLVSVALLFLGGIFLAVLDRRVVFPDRWGRVLARIVAIASALLALAVLGVALADGRAPARASAAWTEFKAGESSGDGPSRLSSLGSNRYDFWRVALSEFSDSPLVGIGADNFAIDYVRERRTLEEPRYPHSLQLRVLTQTGLVGSALFLGFLATALGAVWRARARQGPFSRALAGALVVSFAYWVVHGSIDWFWEFPALAAPAFAGLGMAAAVGAGRDEPSPPASPPRPKAQLALVATAAVAAASFLLPWLAARNVAVAAETWRADPESAFDALARARSLNPLSDRPDLFAGAIASRVGDRERMRAAFRRVLERNPRNWYAYLELAVVEALAGNRAEALRLLRMAGALNPREETVDFVRTRLEEGDPATPAEVDELLLRRLEARTT